MVTARKQQRPMGPARCLYRPKHLPPITVGLTRLGKRILRAAARRTDHSQSEVVEHLLRLHGGSVRMPDEAVTAS